MTCILIYCGICMYTQCIYTVYRCIPVYIKCDGCTQSSRGSESAANQSKRSLPRHSLSLSLVDELAFFSSGRLSKCSPFPARERYAVRLSICYAELWRNADNTASSGLINPGTVSRKAADERASKYIHATSTTCFRP